jgi:sulfite reductase (NADPH) flavoprotein alpha-component
MLANSKIKIVQDLVADLSKEEIIWLNGYLAGIVSTDVKHDKASAANSSVNKITIAYGTETGNAKRLAASFAAKAKKNGIQSKLIGLDQYRLTDLPKEEWFFAVISTQGDGEPPAGAKKFYDHLHQNSVSLSKLKYGVLALGDTAYPLFCKAGEDVDQQLHKLGATRVLPLQKLDTDYEAEADQWFNSLVNSLNNVQPAAAPVTTVVKKSSKQQYAGTVLSNINLNASGSSKETYHIEIAAEDVQFQPGDALGVVPPNSGEVVQKIIALSGVEESNVISYKNSEHSVAELLNKKLSIFYLSERVVKKYSEIVQQEIPETRIDLLDLLRIYPVSNTEQFLNILQILDPITPRLYSIASSPSAHDGEVHLTVGKHNFNINGQWRNGLCSDYLSQLKEGENFEFYIHKNHLFKLPDADKDIIMIGPGTGIAPFRSFIAERDAAGADGRSWLFFGDQHFTTDFLYQTEWQSWLQTGALTKMNVAFSRDQEKKIYVQHKLLQHATEVFEWIENGAYIYICGAKEPMSVDVENTLIQIIKEQRNHSDEGAVQYLEHLKEEGRLVKDVY